MGTVAYHYCRENEKRECHYEHLNPALHAVESSRPDQEDPSKEEQNIESVSEK